MPTRSSGANRAAAAAVAMDAAPAPRRTLKSLAIRGAFWTIGGFAGSQLLRLGSNVVLAWLLVPEAFGLMLLVNMVMQGLQMFSDIGIGPSIIQNERGHDQAFLNTAWTIQIIRGLALWICACLLAWPLAWWFSRSDPLGWQLGQLIPVAGFMAVLGGFFSTRLFTLNRNLAMGRFTAIQAGSQFAGVATMIVWALVSPSVWALVGGGLVSQTCKLVLTHAVIPGPRNRLQWDGESFEALFRFGKWIFLSTAVAFLALQADRILLGSMVPMEVLGVYGFGLMVATLPREVLVHLTGMVLFPALSQHGRTNRESLPEKIHLARAAILPAASAAVLGAALLAPPFFQLLYPANYHDAGWMAQLLSVSVWFVVLASTSDRALLAIGNARPLAAGNVMSLLVTVPSALLGLALLGVPGFILGYACGSLANLVVIQMAMNRAGIPVFAQDLRFSVITGGLMAVGVGGQYLVSLGVDDPVTLQIAVAGVILLAAGGWAVRGASPILRKATAA